MKDKTLEKLLNKVQVEPSSTWTQKVQRLISQDLDASTQKNPNTLFLNSIFMKNKSSILAGVILIVIVIAVGVLLVNPGGTDGDKTSRLNTVALSDSQKREIYNSVINNNPQGVFQTTSNNAYGAGVAESDATAENTEPAPIEDVGKIAPSYFERDANTLYTSKSTYVSGPATGRCSVFGMDIDPLLENTSYESYEYFNDQNESFYKSVSLNSDSNIITYNLSKYDEDSSVNLTYLGGEYAVRESYKYEPITYMEDTPADLMEGESAPSSDGFATDPAADEFLIDQFFGEGTDIVGTYTENGVDYYILQTEYDTNCSSRDAFNVETPDFWNGESYEERGAFTTTNKIVDWSYVHPETFEFVKYESYLDSVGPNNLLYSTTNTIESRSLTASEVEEIFTFEYSVPIRDIEFDDTVYTQPTSEEQANQSIEGLAEDNISVLYLDSTELLLDWVYVNSYDAGYVNSNYKYYSDRGFYPSGRLGDVMFDQYNSFVSFEEANYLMSLGGFSFSEPNNFTKTLSVEVFDGENDDLEVVNYFLYAPVVNKSTENINLNVNGTQMPATVYYYETKLDFPAVYEEQLSRDSAVGYGEVGFPGAQGVCEEEDCISKGHLVIFRTQNRIYSINSYDYNNVNNAGEYKAGMYEGLTFRLLNPSTDRDFLFQKLVEAYNRVPEYEVLPVDPGIGEVEPAL